MSQSKEPPSSQFAFVLLAAKRARQLMAGAPMLLNHTRAHKPTRIAVEELQHQLLEFDVPEISDTERDKDGKRRSE
ncbi:MAG TPA: DNA-directed RNA polymerase subunit omega [Candidatus Solibacter sp.]|nr:DNA-directed RNA polymerase subunit omega [Candidatus Solibacter sp.]